MKFSYIFISILASLLLVYFTIKLINHLNRPIYEPMAVFNQVCDCGNEMTATYIKPYYYFTCANCGKVWTNTDCNDSNEFYALVDFE